MSWFLNSSEQNKLQFLSSHLHLKSLVFWCAKTSFWSSMQNLYLCAT